MKDITTFRPTTGVETRPACSGELGRSSLRGYSEPNCTSGFHPLTDDVFTEVIRTAVGRLSVVEVADALMVSQPTIRRWMSGTNLPHRSMRPAVIEWFKQLPDYGL